MTPNEEKSMSKKNKAATPKHNDGEQERPQIATPSSSNYRSIGGRRVYGYPSVDDIEADRFVSKPVFPPGDDHERDED